MNWFKKSKSKEKHEETLAKIEKMNEDSNSSQEQMHLLKIKFANKSKKNKLKLA